MSYRDSPHYKEAKRRLALKKRCRTDLGRYWHQREFMTALKNMLAEGAGPCESMSRGSG